MRSKKYCKSYVGVACVNGSCPNALRNEDIEAYKDIIDWDKLEVHTETEQHWVTGARKAAR